MKKDGERWRKMEEKKKMEDEGRKIKRRRKKEVSVYVMFVY